MTMKFFLKWETEPQLEKSEGFLKIQWEAYELALGVDIFVYINKCFLVLLQKSFQVLQLSGCCTAGQVNVQQWPKPATGWGWAKSPGMTG